MKTFWEGVLEWLLDEKIILGFLMVFCGTFILILVKWGADKTVIAIFGSAIANLVGALTRGLITKPNGNGEQK